MHLEEDAIGLRAEADITDATVIEEAKAGNLVGWSFGFYPIEYRDTEEDGMPIKELKDIDLREVSLLNKDHIPAYDGTLVAVRDNDSKMVIGESMFADSVEIREEDEPEKKAEAQEEAVKEAQEELRETKEISSIEKNARYKNMIALMKA